MPVPFAQIIQLLLRKALWISVSSIWKQRHSFQVFIQIFHLQQDLPNHLSWELGLLWRITFWTFTILFMKRSFLFIIIPRRITFIWFRDYTSFHQTSHEVQSFFGGTQSRSIWKKRHALEFGIIYTLSHYQRMVQRVCIGIHCTHAVADNHRSNWIIVEVPIRIFVAFYPTPWIMKDDPNLVKEYSKGPFIYIYISMSLVLQR